MVMADVRVMDSWVISTIKLEPQDLLDLLVELLLLLEDLPDLGCQAWQTLTRRKRLPRSTLFSCTETKWSDASRQQSKGSLAWKRLSKR